VNEIAACPRLADPLDGDYRFEKSLARLAVAALVRTWDMAARCRNQGGPGSSVLDISFPRGWGSGVHAAVVRTALALATTLDCIAQPQAAPTHALLDCPVL
jgi:hypothetical protein